MSAGKGDKPRPVNKKVYDKNFQEINWQKTEKRKSCSKKKLINYATQLDYGFHFKK